MSIPVTVVENCCQDSCELNRGEILLVGWRSSESSWPRRLLEEAGYRVREVDSAAAAMAAGGSPNLVLLEASPADLEVVEVIRRLKSMPGCPALLLVVPRSDRETRQRGLEAGADDLLSKPYDEIELLSRAEALLRWQCDRQDLRGERARRELLCRVGHELQTQTDPGALYCRLLGLVSDAFEASTGNLLLLDEWGQVECQISFRRQGQMAVPELSYGPESRSGLASWVAQHRAGAVVTDVRNDIRWAVEPGAGDGPRSAMAVPLLRDQRVVGVLTLAHEEPGRFRADDLPLLTTIARQVAATVCPRSADGAGSAQFKELLAMVAHDLKTPLATIQGFAEILQTTAQEEDRLLAQRIHGSARQMLQLVDNLLHLAAIEAETQPVRMACSLQRAVQEAVEAASPLALQKGVQLTADVPAWLPGVEAGDEQLRRVLGNLIENAIKYTPAEGSVVVRAWAKDGRVTVEVEDSGIGIPQALLPHVFDRFYRTPQPEVREVPGSGLGLAIVKAIVESHGGRIWVRSELGRGSTFGVCLPAAGEHTS